MHRQVVKTLAAAFSKWNLRTDRILSANKVSTYSSPPFRDRTTRSYCKNAARAQSKPILHPSWGSARGIELN